MASNREPIKVVELRDAIEKSLIKDDPERTLSILNSLVNLEITVPILVETKIGLTIAKIKKKNLSPEISLVASRLLKEWKAIAQSAGVKHADSTKVRAKKSPDREIISPKSPAQLENKFNSQEEIKSDSDDGPSFEEAEEGEVLPHRKKMRKLLYDILMMPEDEFESNMALSVAAACGIEREINVQMSFLNKRVDYNAKMRQLVFNLKRNSELRLNILRGECTYERLISMSPSDLLTSAKRKEVEEVAKELTDARRLDWREKNQEAINKQCGIQKNEGMFECGRCKSKNTTYFQKQTRSADEPMTTFVTCLNCTKKWKFC